MKIYSRRDHGVPSDHTERQEKADRLRSKMAIDMARQWIKGEKALVKNTIETAPTSEMKRLWKDSILEALPSDQRQLFLEHMRA